MTQAFLRTNPNALPPSRGGVLALGRALVEAGHIAPWQLFFARRQQRREESGFLEVLRARGWITSAIARDALAAHFSAVPVDLQTDPPDPGLSSLLPPDLCLRLSVVPWRHTDGRITLACSAPDRLMARRARLPAPLRRADIVVATPEDIVRATARLHRASLTHQAETRPLPRFSCRSWQRSRARGPILLALALLCLAALVFYPMALASGLTLWAMFSLTAVSVMKLAAFVAHDTAAQAKPPAPVTPDLPLPRIS
ncbi:MAG: hypothetical protein OQK00_12280, partial [Rhodobacteraceae bacterium]|nr:hypothetical protein [Paracoccaceae bacterium]